MKGYVLSIDPGVKIGVALVSVHKGRIIDHGVIDTSEGEAEWSTLLHAWFLSYADDAEVIAEKGPSFGRHNRAILEAIEAKILGWRDDVEWILPASWKKHPSSHVTQAERQRMTQHEADAAGMARYHIAKENRA